MEIIRSDSHRRSDGRTTISPATPRARPATGTGTARPPRRPCPTFALQEALDGKVVTWMEKVTNDEYLAAQPAE